MDAKAHWEAVYRTKPPTEVSWYQEQPALSLRLIQQSASDRDAPILNVGAGVSVLQQALVTVGYTDLTAIDISGTALEAAQAAWGDGANKVRWIEGDILDVGLPEAHFGLWHDRAVFHFLIEVEAREAYLRQLRHALRPGGHVILATFAEDGPSKCSGLEVQRYSTASLSDELGADFDPVDAHQEEHRTPGGSTQRFQYLVCRRR